MPIEHVVCQGEGLSAIAARYGLLPDTIWSDPANAQLKNRRGNPNTLLPGDRLQIPDRRTGEVSVTTERRHRFKAAIKAVHFRVRLMVPKPPEPAKTAPGSGEYAYEDPQYRPERTPMKPLANLPFIANVDDGTLIKGTTNGAGLADIQVSPHAKAVRLTVRPGQPEERTFHFHLGGLDPVEEPSGVAQRLRNLGYPCAEAREVDDSFAAVLRDFQTQNRITVTGAIDAATKDKLVELHGS